MSGKNLPTTVTDHVMTMNTEGSYFTTLTSYLIPFRELPDRAAAFTRHDDFGFRLKKSSRTKDKKPGAETK